MKKVWIATNVTQGRLNVPGYCVLGPGETVDVSEPISAEVSILTGRPKLLTLTPKPTPVKSKAVAEVPASTPKPADSPSKSRRSQE